MSIRRYLVRGGLGCVVFIVIRIIVLVVVVLIGRILVRRASPSSSRGSIPSVVPIFSRPRGTSPATPLAFRATFRGVELPLPTSLVQSSSRVGTAVLSRLYYLHLVGGFGRFGIRPRFGAPLVHIPSFSVNIPEPLRHMFGPGSLGMFLGNIQDQVPVQGRGNI